MRILLFLGTNIAIMVLLSLVFSLLGLEGVLASNGVDLNLQALLVYSAVIGFSGSIISLLISKWMAKRSMGVHIIAQASNPTERWLVDTVKKQAQEAKIGMPEVGIFNHPSPNAFATGWNKNNALVAVSTGLLHSMSKDEVEAVLAHEVSHVANGDMVTLTLIQGVVNTFVVFLSRVIGFIVDRAVFKVERGHGPAFYIVSFVMQIVLGILATAITMWFSRYREFKADAGGAKLAGRENMIAALEKLKRGNAEEAIPEEMAAFAINAGKVSKIFASHPPLDERIQALKNAR
ncbi:MULTISPECIES: protease HtpX [Alteromonadaceae]|uniref:Protease HtpX n=1 Tax=Brumicola blandensis TaxID=3075611 RepID=A0AAW8QZD1_9ALTE|nr:MULTISPECIES: protease HtpX [unclassified Alteromonas]MDT0582302.1 protease HtpX [Alteromonas sp. W409]MDT0628523.1 protease HtpX [Alteromonas sp. W364]